MGSSKQWMPLTVTESWFPLHLMRFSVHVSSLLPPLSPALPTVHSAGQLARGLGSQLLFTRTGTLSGDRWPGGEDRQKGCWDLTATCNSAAVPADLLWGTFQFPLSWIRPLRSWGAACRAKQGSCQTQPGKQRLKKNLRNPCFLTCRVRSSQHSFPFQWLRLNAIF